MHWEPTQLAELTDAVKHHPKPHAVSYTHLRAHET